MVVKRNLAFGPRVRSPDRTGPVGPLWGQLLTECEVAQLLQVSPNTLRYWRRKGQRRGPNYVKIERRLVRYRVKDLESYLQRRAVRGRMRE
jgi:predicted DNA-binding transcriptional regulator AlpA